MSVGYLNAVDTSSGQPVDVIRSLQTRLNNLPLYVGIYKIMGTNDKDLNSNIDEKAKIVEFPRALNQQFRDAWTALAVYAPVRPYPPDAGLTVENTKEHVAEMLSRYAAAQPARGPTMQITGNRGVDNPNGVSDFTRWWRGHTTAVAIGGAGVGLLLLVLLLKKRRAPAAA